MRLRSLGFRALIEGIQLYWKFWLSTWGRIGRDEQDPRSPAAVGADRVIRSFNRRGPLRERDAAEKFVRRQRFLNDGYWRSRIGFLPNVSRSTMHGIDVIRYGGEADSTTTRVLYIHGGGYAHRPFVFQELMAEELARKSDSEIFMPLYPLAPNHTAPEVIPMMEKLLDELNPDVIMGDSAGGGMSLALEQLRQKKGKAATKEIILISPWLDITMTDEAAAAIQENDSMLDLTTMIVAGEIWAGEWETTDHRVSPMYGSLEGLGRISVFSGTFDVLNADARKLCRIAKEQGREVNYHEVEGMNHVWPVFPISEAREARREMAEIIKAAN